MRDLLETTFRIEAGGELVGEGLIMDKAIGMGGANGLFVKTLSLELAPLDTGDLRAHQCGAGFEILRAIFRPYFELPMMGARASKCCRCSSGREDGGPPGRLSVNRSTPHGKAHYKSDTPPFQKVMAVTLLSTRCALNDAATAEA